FSARAPQSDQQYQSRDWKKISPPDTLADLPTRINDGHIRGPEELSQVKPKQSPRDQQSIDQRKIKRLAMLDTKFLLYPDRDDPGDNRDAKKRNQRFTVALPSQLSTLPPKNNQ